MKITEWVLGSFSNIETIDYPILKDELRRDYKNVLVAKTDTYTLSSIVDYCIKLFDKISIILLG